MHRNIQVHTGLYFEYVKTKFYAKKNSGKHQYKYDANVWHANGENSLEKRKLRRKKLKSNSFR